jgi:hypothetical protein
MTTNCSALSLRAANIQQRIDSLLLRLVSNPDLRADRIGRLPDASRLWLLGDSRLGREKPNMLLIGIDRHTSFQQIAFFEEETGECDEQQLSRTRKPNASTPVLPASTNSSIPLSSPPSAPPSTPIPSLSVSSLPAQPQTSAPVPHSSKPRAKQFRPPSSHSEF